MPQPDFLFGISTLGPPGVPPSFGLNMKIACERSELPWGTDTRLHEAMAAADRFSTQGSMPQTVYRDDESGGWWHIHAFAQRLNKAEVHTTFLPANYFR